MRKLSLHRVTNILKVIGLVIITHFICLAVGNAFYFLTGAEAEYVWYHPAYAGIGFVLLIVLVVFGFLGYILFDYIAPKERGE